MTNKDDRGMAPPKYDPPALDWEEDEPDNRKAAEKKRLLPEESKPLTYNPFKKLLEKK